MGEAIKVDLSRLVIRYQFRASRYSMQTGVVGAGTVLLSRWPLMKVVFPCVL
jgi:hypothetical protein